ncbi:MAG: aspartate aminotransferase family protein, partial [Geodermatophilaceae bacterium]
PGHMSPQQFREHGRQVVDWIADYLETIESRPVRSQVAPGEISAQLPAHPPEEPEPFAAVLGDLDKILLPGITHWQHPSPLRLLPGELLGSGDPR